MNHYLKLFITWHRLKTFQYKDVDEIKLYQLHVFKQLVQHAYDRVTLYRDFYDSHNFEPNSIQNYDDIENVPVITKDILRNATLKQRVDSRVSE